MDITNLLGPLYHLVGDVLRQRYLEPCCDRRDLPDNVMNDSQHFRVIECLRHAVVDDHRERVEGAVPTHLLPFVATNILHNLARQACLLEEVGDQTYPQALVSHQLSDRERPAFVMLDDPGRDVLGVNECDSANHAVTREPFEKAVFGLHAVLQRQEYSPGVHHRLDLIHHCGQVIRLDRQDD